MLTHVLCLAFHTRDIGKQCRFRSDAAAVSTIISIADGNTKNKTYALSIGNGPVQRVKVRMFT